MNIEDWKKLAEKGIKGSAEKQLKVFNQTFMTKLIFKLTLIYIAIFKPKI